LNSVTDSAGPRVFDILAAVDLPRNVEVIDGGTTGIGLLRFADGAARLVFVDSVTGFGPPGSVVDLSVHDVLATSRPEPHGHGSGLDFLLRALPIACEGPVPEVIGGVARDRAGTPRRPRGKAARGREA
jgi:hydrogenase maturation protease